MFEKTMGVENFIWWLLACGAVWLLYRIFELVKGIHDMIFTKYKRDLRND